MPSLLYISHAYHETTKSNDFLQELLAEEYTTTKYNIDPYQDTLPDVFNITGKHYDIVVCFQVLPPRDFLEQQISFTQGVFFPMYDTIHAQITHKPPYSAWDIYKDFLIINFSKTAHDIFTQQGFHSKYIQYFPKPLEVSTLGDSSSLFFWQRHAKININTAYTLLKNNNNISKAHIHHAPDPGQPNIPPAKITWEVTNSTWFPTRQNLQETIEQSALYFAPRETEGIGMSFLEAMAMGRLVIAPNNPTMNEYITHGETGYLYDLDNLQPIQLKSIDQIQANTIEYIKNGYTKWEVEKNNILSWIQEHAQQVEKCPTKKTASTLQKYFLKLGIYHFLYKVSVGAKRKKFKLTFKILRSALTNIKTKKYYFLGIPIYKIDSYKEASQGFLFNIIPLHTKTGSHRKTRYKLLGVTVYSIKKDYDYSKKKL